MTFSRETLLRLAAPVPRYTSYPTANHFTNDIEPNDYADWLAEIDESARLSIYLHIPFCHSLCWYCACSTKATRKYPPIRRYVDTLLKELNTVADLLPSRLAVSHLHWGGGSPTLLAPEEVDRIAQALGSRFAIERDAEHAVEIDPRALGLEQIAAFSAAGMNRASLGVQDFDPGVQAAIGREQSYEMTRRAVDALRAAGVGAINIDLVYGLPRQTLKSLAATVRKVVSLGPTRIAVFGYAHLPARVPNQRLIDASALPDVVARFEQAQMIAALLAENGYKAVGLDHYALPGDPLARQQVHRNFQGYTTDAATALLGFGASAIGKLPRGYVQNAASTHDYERRIASHGLATARGCELTPDDHVRAFAIERLMCDFRLSTRALTERFGATALPTVFRIRDLVRRDTDGLLESTEDGVRVTDRGRPFVRTICAGLDRYFGSSMAARHSLSV